MPSFWEVVNEVIDEADVVLEILDARFPEETRNKEIENKLIRKHKKIIYILNKSDLLTEKFSSFKFDFEPYIFVSAKNNLGTTRLRSILKDLAREKENTYTKLKTMVKSKLKEVPLLVGVLGYPNTGKSSLINVMKQKKSALTSSTPGFTRGMQKIRIGKNIYLIDTPGVFAYKEYKKSDDVMYTLANIKDYRKIKDPDTVAINILNRAIKNNPRIIEELYKIKPTEDAEETLELIAKKYNWLVKGGKPNIDQVSRKIIQDWQRGRLII